MATFIDVDPNEIPNVREGRRGRENYPILKAFMETNKFIVKLDTTHMNRRFMAIYTGLNGHAKKHELPIKVFSRGGEIYLMRLDIDAEGNRVEDWDTPEEVAPTIAQPTRSPLPQPITAAEVTRRYEAEVGKGIIHG